jgi:TATA-binding protein-associated factor
MGRLAGIPYFASCGAYNKEKEDQTRIRKAKKALLEEGDLTDDSPEKDQLRKIQVLIAMEMAKKFSDRILRRTVNSKDWEGNTLLQLPPFKTILGIVGITNWETDIIQQLAEAAKEK